MTGRYRSGASVALLLRPNSDATRQCIRFQQLLLPDRGARLPGTTTGHKLVEGETLFWLLNFFAAAERWNITACSPTGLLGRAETSQPSPYWVRLRSAAAVIGGYVPLHGCSPACRQCRCHRRREKTVILQKCGRLARSNEACVKKINSPVYGLL